MSIASSSGAEWREFGANEYDAISPLTDSPPIRKNPSAENESLSGEC